MGLPAVSDDRAILDHALDVAREAGRIAMDALDRVGRRRDDGVERKSPRELVTEVDRRIERQVVGEVRSTFPDHAIEAEEGGGSPDVDSPWRWIVDPLDGTTNYVCGHPFFCTSIAVFHEGEPVVGVVHAPYLDETFFARTGQGTRLNSERIEVAVTGTDELDDAILGTGFAYDRERWPNYENTLRMLRAARDIRRAGSAALDLAYVAAGRLDGFWELGLRPWDVAAGALLVREAGGVVTDRNGGDDWLRGGHIIASNGAIHAGIADGLEPFPPDETADGP